MTRPRIRGVVVFKAATPVRWHDQPKPACFNRAQRELERLNIPAAAQTVDRASRRSG